MRGLRLIACVSALVVGAQASAQARPFWTTVWLHDAPTAERLERLRASGFDSVSVGRGQDPEAVRAAGLAFYGDQVGGKGILELRNVQWRAWRESFLRARDPRVASRPNCLADAAVRRQLVDLVQAGTRRLIAEDGQPPFAVSLCDEASATRRANPMDQVASPTFLEAFRKDLRERLDGDLSALNDRWGSSFQSFDEVTPWATDRMRERAHSTRRLPRRLAPWADGLAFQDRVFARALGEACDAVTRIAPDLPAGPTGMQPSACFGGHDYREILARVTYFEAYDIGGARDLALSFRRPGTPFVETVFPPGKEGSARSPAHQWSTALAHGASGVIVWSSREVEQREGYRNLLRSTGESLEGPAKAFAGASLNYDRVWMVESRPSTFAWWMLDSQIDGDTWTERLTSYESRHGTSLRARLGWLSLLNDLGYQPRLVDQRDLVERLERGAPRAIVLPACLALSDEAVDALRRFVRDGGHLIADHSPGLYDEGLKLRATGPFDDLFGIAKRSRDRRDLLVRNATIGDGDRTRDGIGWAERGLVNALDPDDEQPHLLQRSIARGGVSYLNLAVCEYPEIRVDPGRSAGARVLRGFVAARLGEAGLRPFVVAEIEGVEPQLEALRLRSPDGRDLLAICADLESVPAEIREDPETPLLLEFPVVVELTDLRTGRVLSRAKRFELPFDSYLGAFFVVRR